jgi:hypothetical protein
LIGTQGSSAAIVRSGNHYSGVQEGRALVRYRNDLSYAEIALVADVPVGTVKTRVHHAKRALQKRFQGRVISVWQVIELMRSPLFGGGLFPTSAFFGALYPLLLMLGAPAHRDAEHHRHLPAAPHREPD